MNGDDMTAMKVAMTMALMMSCFIWFSFVCLLHMSVPLIARNALHGSDCNSFRLSILSAVP